MAVRCARTWLRLVVVCVVVAQIGPCSGGLVRNLWHGAGIGFDIDGLEMVVFTFGSGSVVADVSRMFEFMWESGCSAVADGPGMFEFVWESGSSTVDGPGMGVCSGHMCWQLWW